MDSDQGDRDGPMTHGGRPCHCIANRGDSADACRADHEPANSRHLFQWKYMKRQQLLQL
jgi:hypothetical protein